MTTDRETVTRILGLPEERIEALHTTYGMPFEEEAFSAWFVANARLVLDELKQHHESLIFPAQFRPELTETSA